MLSKKYPINDLQDGNMSSQEEGEIKIEPEDPGDGGGYDTDTVPETKFLSESGNNTSDGWKSPTNERQGEKVLYDLAMTYICPSCGDEFETRIAWKQHLNEQHEFNTPSGINFVPIDKLYYKCLECKKLIAMYAMENLLKHKFSHLPHPCTRCKICNRRYKYRQGLSAHLRLCHNKELLSMMEIANKSNRNSPKVLEIKYVKGNAVDIFENTCDNGVVKIEPITLDETDDETLLKPLSASSQFLEKVHSQSFSYLSDKRQREKDNANKKGIKFIQFICPVCSMEFTMKSEWFEHIEEMHNFCTIKGLGFKQRTETTVECLECKRIMPDKCIEQLQLHKFSHLPCKTCVRCKLCLRSYTSHKNIKQHLFNQHGVDGEYDEKSNDSSQDGSLLDPCYVTTYDNEGAVMFEIKFLDEGISEGTFSEGNTSLPYVGNGNEKGEKDNFDDSLGYAPERPEVFGECFMPLQKQHQTDRLASRSNRLNCPSSYSTFSTPIALQKHGEQHELKKHPAQLTIEDVRSCNRAVDHELIIYHCPQCNEVFHTHTLWRLHMGSAHDLNSWYGLNFRPLSENIYVCLECYKRVVTHTKSKIIHLQSHKFRHLPYKSFSCVKCNKFFLLKQMFLKHLNLNNKCPMWDNEHLYNLNETIEKPSTEDSTKGLVRAISAYIGNPTFATQKMGIRCGSASKSPPST